MPRLILLIGLPGSGKSFLASQLLAECPSRRLISTDAIRAQLFGDEATQGPWLKVWREVERQMRQAVTEIHQERVTEAIYDATNAARKQRRAVLALSRAIGFTQIIGVYVTTPLEVCLSRNNQRQRQVPEEVILHMHRQLTDIPPSVTEGMDQVIYSGL